MEKSWYIYNKKADFYALGQSLGVSPVLVKIMRNRDLKTEQEMRRFLSASMAELSDPSLLPDAEKAAEKIREKIQEGKKIRIAGDYDIDGVCATYILFDALKTLGAKVSYVIPERIRDGYGLNQRIIEEAIRDGIDTIITCDNGISALEEMRKAAKSGITVILTDHHDLRKDEAGKDILPEAFAVVNAKREDSGYPQREICGAVTAWKLIELVFEKYGRPKKDWEKYLEFAALATVGDVMKLTGENRIIVSEGLSRLNRFVQNRGLRALVSACGLEEKKITTYHIGFVIGPCINAGGRLETAEKAMQLFQAETDAEAFQFAEGLRQLNEQRKAGTNAGVQKASEAALQCFSEDKVLVIYQNDLHESLAGIVAGRIREEFGKPCYILTDTGQEDEAKGDGSKELKGSGRSIEAYDMFRKLSECDDLLLKYGGHPMAAGLSLKKDQLEALRRRLNENCNLKQEDLIQKLWIDLQLPFSCVTEELTGELGRLEPFGTGNERPVFACRSVKLLNHCVLGKDRNVLKMEAIDAAGARFSAIMFGKADEIREKLKTRPLWDILYYPQINEYRGMRQVELKIEDVR